MRDAFLRSVENVAGGRLSPTLPALRAFRPLDVLQTSPGAAKFPELPPGECGALEETAYMRKDEDPTARKSWGSACGLVSERVRVCVCLYVCACVIHGWANVRWQT